MRKLIVAFITFLIFRPAMALDFYFSDSQGSDSWTISQAQNSATPWKSLNKASTVFTTGNRLFFKRGDTFKGTLIAQGSGTFGNNVVVMYYGSGADPVFTGLTDITSWTNVSGNIWESSSAVSSLSTCNIAYINGGNYAQGRTPNTGYWTIGSTNGNSIVDGTNLNAAVTNWTGAQVVLRKYRWITDKFTIASASGSTINFTNSGDEVRDGWGYFIQNDQKCLDQNNEWSYSASTKKFSIYKTSTPTNVKAPSVATGIDLNGKNYITIDGIEIIGYNNYGINAPGNDNIIIRNCKISFIGDVAIYQYQQGGSASSCVIQNNTITQIGSMGIYAGFGSSALITGNTVTHIGRYPGMGGNGDVSYCGIVNVGNTHEISNNIIRATGYCGIRWDGNAALIQKNFVDSFCFSKDDGGGIYVYPNATGPSDTVSYTTRTVRDNIVINGIGALAGGEPSSNYGEVMCFYNDGTSPDVIYRHNTAASSYYGAFFNSGQRITIDSNLIYDCRRNIHAVKYSGYPIEDWTIRHNTSVAKENNQYALYLEPGTNQIPASWDLDYNCYARPLSDNQTIWYDPGGSNVYVTLAQWKAAAFASGEDQNSTKGFKEVSTTNDLLFIYNETGSTVTKPLPAKYANVNGGATYVGQITLAPYSSAVLIKTGAIVMPNLINWKRSVAGGKEFRWQSAEEDNLAYYSVEESADAGKTWKVIGKKMAVGPSTYILRP